jgi:medium-chain acyl-[acyl-carrier-protein] hydrolase
VSVKLKSLTPRGHAGCELICFPYAGGGPSVFRQWPRSPLPRITNISAVHLPGREDLINEDPECDFPRIVEQLVDLIEPLAAGPLVLFGHSLGAIFAAHVAQEVLRKGRASNGALVVSARCPPWAYSRSGDGERGPAQTGSISDLVQGSADITVSLDLANLVMPMIHGDLALANSARRLTQESAWSLREAAVSCPVTALRGARDTGTPAESMRQWSRFTVGSFQEICINAGHLFVNTHGSEVIGVVTSVACELLVT